MAQPPNKHPAGDRHHQAASHHHAAAHHHHQAAHHYDLCEFDEAEKHAAAAREYSLLAFELSATTGDRSERRFLNVIEH